MTDLEGPPEHDLVEWDYTYARALAFRPAGEEHVAPTGAERAADSATRWLPVVPEYPEDFLPRFPELLGRSVFLLSDDGLHVRQLFPGADFDPGNVRRLLEFSVQQTRRDRLEQTMYFAVEAMETGEPVPPDVAGRRSPSFRTSRSSSPPCRTSSRGTRRRWPSPPSPTPADGPSSRSSASRPTPPTVPSSPSEVM
jgi:hypothetical protein